MFSFGVMEIGVVCLLAVLLFPPRDLPKLARTVARYYGKIRRTAEDFKSAILEDPDLNEPIDEIKSAYRKSRWEVQRAQEAARNELAKARLDARMAVRGRDVDDDAHPKIKGRVPVLDDADLDEEDDDIEDDRVSHAPLAVAKDPEGDDAGGDDSAPSQGVG